MKKRQRGKSSAVIAIPVILLCACAVLLCTKLAGMRVEAASPVSVTIPETMAAAEGTSAETISRQAQTLSLYNKNPDENIPFRMTNMFPGDSKTQYYRVSVSYTGTVTVSFRAVPEEDGDKLGDALKAKVLLMNTGQVLYEGSIAGMPQLDHVLNAGSEERTEELFYEITIGLGTDAGNEYQNQRLNADLCWWAEGAERPDEPVKPSEPDEGGESDEPTKPSEPDNDGESEDSAGDEGDDDSQGGSLIDPPGTGDDSRLMMWLAVFGVALVSMIVVLAKCGRREQIMVCAGAMEESGQMEQYRYLGQTGVQKRKRRLLLGILLVVLLMLAFGITSWALVYRKVMVEDNLFQTGKVSICLNDNQPVFNEDMLFEPGMVVEKDFTLRSDSSCDVYYRLYFSDIDGEFAEVLTVAVADGERIIFRGTLAEMNGVRSEGAAGLLREGEERSMRITFHVPEDCGNRMQNQTILFDLHAEAVQAVNNPLGLFE